MVMASHVASQGREVHYPIMGRMIPALYHVVGWGEMSELGSSFSRQVWPLSNHVYRESGHTTQISSRDEGVEID